MAVATTLDEMPTLRLVTLRRLVRRTVPPVVFEQETPLGVIEDVLQQIPAATAILVDGARIYQGTLGLPDVRGCDRTQSAEQAMTIDTPVLRAEDDVDVARSAMRTTDRVLVIAPDGELLGVLTIDDLASRPSR